jgi:hypothetical protein
MHQATRSGETEVNTIWADFTETVAVTGQNYCDRADLLDTGHQTTAGP